MASFRIKNVGFATLPTDHPLVTEWKDDVIHIEGQVPDDGEAAAHIIAETITRETGHYVTSIDVEEWDADESNL
jgi:hypothetical protein